MFLETALVQQNSDWGKICTNHIPAEDWHSVDWFPVCIGLDGWYHDLEHTCNVLTNLQIGSEDMVAKYTWKNAGFPLQA